MEFGFFGFRRRRRRVFRSAEFGPDLDGFVVVVDGLRDASFAGDTEGDSRLDPDFLFESGGDFGVGEHVHDA